MNATHAGTPRSAQSVCSSPRARAAAFVVRACWAIVALACLAYGAAAAGVLVFDDIHSIANNTALRDLGNLGRFWTDPSAFSAGGGRMYRPVVLTTLALDLAATPAPWLLKATNVALHAAVAVLGFLWVCRVTRRLVPSAALGALFAVHPLASEAINLVSARSELLAVAGLLLALHGHLGWLRGGRGIRAITLMLVGAVVACGSKEVGVMAPALCAAQAAWLRASRRSGAWLRDAVVGVLPTLAVAVVYLVARKLLLGEVAVHLLDRAGDDPQSGGGRSVGVQLATMGALLPWSLWHMVAPWPLSLDPAVAFRTPSDPVAWLGWGAMAALTLWACRRGSGAAGRRLGVVFAWLLALPWVVVPLNMPLAEHRLYGPMLGVGLAVVAALPRWRAARAPQTRPWLVAAAGAVALLGIALSTSQSLRYRDVVGLWQHELAQNPASWRAWWGIGARRLTEGDAPAAVAALASAHAIYPRQVDVLRHYVEALVALPDAVAEPERALACAVRLRQATPDDPWTRTLQAQAHLQRGRVRKDDGAFVAAESEALSCLQIAEPKAYVFRLAAAARRGLRDLDGALAHLDASVARGLAPTEVRLERAALLRELGRIAEARAELRAAQQSAPNDLAVQLALQRFAAPPR